MEENIQIILQKDETKYLTFDIYKKNIATFVCLNSRG